MATPPKPPLLLTAHQKAIVDKDYKKDLLEIAREVFGDLTIDDRRDRRVKAVKEYIASVDGNNDKSSWERPQIILKDEHKQYIKSNYLNATPLEMAKILSKDPETRSNSLWARAVAKFVREVDPEFARQDEMCDGPYEPPVNSNVVIGLVNQHAINPKSDGKSIYDPSKLTASDRRNLQALTDYMRKPLFILSANKFSKRTDRDLYIAQFVMLAWDKPDLLGEEFTQYVALAAETVKEMQIDRQIQLIDERLNDVLSSGDSSELKMNEVELLNSMREKANASMKQQAALIQKLAGDRSKRLMAKVSANNSLHNLVQAWRIKEDRDRIIKLNENTKKEDLRKEVERLSSMDALKAEFFGLDKENILS